MQLKLTNNLISNILINILKIMSLLSATSAVYFTPVPAPENFRIVESNLTELKLRVSSVFFFLKMEFEQKILRFPRFIEHKETKGAETKANVSSRSS